jgi:hypothetical protein
MLNYTPKIFALELQNFLSFLKINPMNMITKSDFLRAPKNISSRALKQTPRALITEFNMANKPDIKTWNGFRLLAINTSQINLPITNDLKAYFGNKKSYLNTSILKARCSVLYDLENNYVLDGELEPISKSKNAMALSHLDYCKKGDLILFDRTCPSYNFVEYHVINNLDYVIRAKFSFSKIIFDFKNSKKQSEIVTMTSDRSKQLSHKASDESTPIKVRLIRIEIPNGQVEVLMTSLLDIKKYPDHIFQSLYYKRWSSETFYDELKNKLKVEHFSGHCRKSILQEFYAALFINNVQKQIVSEFEEEIAEKKNLRRLDYNINNNISYTFLKNKVLELFFTENSIEEPLNEIKQLFRSA